MASLYDDTKLRNYFKLLDEGKLKQYSSLVFVQLAHCMFVGSADTSNPGQHFIQDRDGTTKEIIRADREREFVNSVNMLHSLMKNKLDKDEKDSIIIEPDYEGAKKNFDILLQHVHKSGLFGEEELVVKWQA